MDRSPDTAELLARFRAAHCRVLNCITEMERITGDSMPDVASCTSARLRISRASLERRALWQSARRLLQRKVTTGDSDNLRLLASIDLELGSHSADHIGRWTVAAIQSDWAGYRNASRQMRRRMAQCIEAEKRILYPLLTRYS